MFMLLYPPSILKVIFRLRELEGRKERDFKVCIFLVLGESFGKKGF